MGRGKRALVAALVGLGAVGCRGTQVAGGDGASVLYVSPDRYDFDRSPGLLQRVRSSPFGYFRLINSAFANEVCRRFADDIEHMPSVNLHGDAHLEQYAITDVGRGLTDFDDSASGPAILDLVRFGTSVRLAAREHGWAAESPRIHAEFVRGYQDAMRDPQLQPPPPPIVLRIQEAFRFDSEAFFGWIAAISDPMAPQIEAQISSALQPYFAAMRDADPSLDPGYFEVQTIGRPRIGIGSALDRKYLVRVRGPSDAPEDDDILELKEVRDLSSIRCIDAQRRGPFRALVAQARIAYQPSRLLGYVRLGSDYFWVHAWVKNYEELIVGRAFGSPEELLTVAYDVGVQLGKGHPKDIAAPFETQLRRETLEFVEANAQRIFEACGQLADETVRSWELFTRKTAR